jgi:hypothetical protein
VSIVTEWAERAAGLDTVDELAALWREGAEVHGLDFGHDRVTGEGSPGGQHIEASGYNPEGR